MEEDSGIAIALQHFLLHAFVASRVPTLPGSSIDKDLAFRHAGGGGLKKNSPLFNLNVPRVV